MDYFFNIEDKDELQKYFELLVKKITLNDDSATYETEIKDKILLQRFNDNIDAFKILSTALENRDDLNEDLITEVANKVNESSVYIKKGYRNIGNTIADTGIITSNPKDIPSHLAQLIYDYFITWSAFDIYTREALFHMDFIHIHPFEDGNGRTARLLMAFNLTKQGYVTPVIDILCIEEYDKYIKEFNVEGLTELFKRQALKEAEHINNKSVIK